MLSTSHPLSTPHVEIIDYQYTRSVDMSSLILDNFSIWSSVCPSDEEGLSDCFDDSPEFGGFGTADR